MPPRVIVGRYELLEELGSGGAAVVYRARDVRLDRIVAVKVLREHLAEDQDFLARFQREARAAASLNHPNIVDVYDFGTGNDATFIAMEYVDGGNLKEYIRERGQISPTETLRIARQVLSALAAAHDRGLVHRDVKPQNILLTSSGEAKLADFGIALNQSAAELTQAGMTMGTAAYIAPEQAVGSAVGPPADIYGLGLCIYEMLIGRPPFVGGTPLQIAYRQVNEPIVPPSQILPALPASLDAAVVKALAKDPAGRYPSASAMLAALDAAVPGSHDSTAPMQTVRLPTAGVASDATTINVNPPARRSPTTGLILILGLVGLLALCGLVGLLGGQRFGLLGASAPPAATSRAAATPPRSPGPPSAVAVATSSPRGAPAAPPTSIAPTLTATATASPTPTATPPPPSATPPPPTATRPPPTATPPPPTATVPPPTATPLLRPVATPTAAPPPLPPPVAPPTATLPPPQPAPTQPVPPQPVPPKPAPGKPSAAVDDVTLPDTAFEGGFRNPGGSIYRGRPATWIYGTQTPYSTMTARFDLPAVPRGQARLRVTAIDSEGSAKTTIAVLINDREIFRGPSPFPNDTPSTPEAPWTEQALPIPNGVLRQGANTLTFRNLENSANVGAPPFFMLTSATIDLRN